MQPRIWAALLAALLLTTAPVAMAAGGDEHDHASDDNETDDVATNETNATEDESEANETSDAGHEHDEAAHDEAAHEEDDEREDEASGEEDASDEDERDADEEAREVKVLVEQSRALFELEKEGDDSEEEVKIDYDADEAVLKLEFGQESNGTESAFEFKVEMERVIEYVDLDANGAYDEDVDHLVAQHKVDEDMTWTVLGMEDVTMGNLTGKKVTSEGTFHDVNGTMRIVFYAFGDFADIEGVSLRPTDVKFDIVFEGYGYANASSALALEVETEYEAEYEGAAQGAGLAASAGNVTGYFTWADWAIVDGNRTAVLVSGLEEESESSEDETKVERSLYLNYARGASILHDPVMGVSYTTAASSESGGTDGTTDTTGTDGASQTGTAATSGDNATPGVGVAAALAAMAALAVARRRKDA